MAYGTIKNDTDEVGGPAQSVEGMYLIFTLISCICISDTSTWIYTVMWLKHPLASVVQIAIVEWD